MIPRQAAVVVIGAGPAGLAAARVLADRGVRAVLVLDRDDAPGGVPRFCHHLGFGWEYTRRIESGPKFVRRLLGALDPAVVTIATRTTVLDLRPGPEIEIVGADCGPARIRAGAVVVATGIRERSRAARLVPGRRPERGILTTGQLQQMVARGVPVGGRHAVIVGTEHVSFSVLLTARRAGLEIVAMVEPLDRVMSYAGIGWAARTVLGVPIHLSSRIDDIAGGEAVESVVIHGPSGSFALPCDTVIFTGDFLPDANLTRTSGAAIDPRTGGPIVDQRGRTSLPGVFAAGNLLRAVESGGIAALEGASVGANAAAYVGGALDWTDDAPPVQLGDGLAYLVPQCWDRKRAVATAIATLPISLRSSTDADRRRLSLSEAGQEMWSSGPIRPLRQRRIKMPAAAFERLSGGGPVMLNLIAI